MLSLSTHLFYLADLKNLKDENRCFGDSSVPYLAGRCILDALEYLRVDLKWPAQFGQLTNAHAMRLLLRYLSKLGRRDIQDRMKERFEYTYKQIRATRTSSPPFYGHDFWDWASILDALVCLGNAYPELCDKKAVVKQEINAFRREVKEKLSYGLTFDRKGEWFGPATAVAAYKILDNYKEYIEDDFRDILKELKNRALIPIEDGKYLSRTVLPHYYAWHYGQVVSCFSGDESKFQKEQVRDLHSIQELPEKCDQVYALARVIQGVHEIGDEETKSAALKMIYDCQELGRPFGTGLLADSVKGSLNVLEAIWPMLKMADFDDVNAMLDELLVLYKSVNTVGVVVAVPKEVEACKKAFEAVGAQVKIRDQSLIVHHKNYEAVIVHDKSTLGAAKATNDLIDKHNARWILNIGIAGSLGKPTKGDVVIATSTAAFGIREKVRQEVESVRVPFQGIEWDILPTDPQLFSVAHRLRKDFVGKHKVHEGLIITGNGIKDSLKEKDRILAEWPGGVAVEEEGFVVGLLSTVRGVRYIVIRGISDLAAGDKITQQSEDGTEEFDQQKAAEIAATLGVGIIEALSQQW